MKNSTKDNLTFWGAASAVGAVSGFVAWLCSAPWWLIAVCAVGLPLLAVYALLIMMSRMISNI